MAMKKAMVLWLKLDAEKAEARAAAAKQQARSAKATLKRARKLFKAAKKAAKQARKKAEAALAPTTRQPKAPVDRQPARSRKAAVKPPAGKAPAAKQPASKKVRVARKSRRMRKPRADASPEYLRSVADVAKAVIDRLHSPPPALPPELSIPAEVKPEQPV